METLLNFFRNLFKPKQSEPVSEVIQKSPVPILTQEPVDQPKPEEKKKSPPWYLYAIKFKGRREEESAFNKEMSSKWYLVGLPHFKTIIGSSYAWCGLFVAVALAGVGVDYQKNGAGAKNWAQYGVEINWKQDGIPQGAIVQINHERCGSSSSNHVALASGDCTAADLLKKDATIDLYGGNQSNTAKVSTYSVKEICAVRWPKDVKDFPKPGPVRMSDNCTSKSSSKESTR